MSTSRGARRRRSRVRAPIPSTRSTGRPAHGTPRAGRRTCGLGTCGRIGPAPRSWPSPPGWTTGAAMHRRSGERSARRRRRSAHPAIPRCGCTDRGRCSSAAIRRTGRLRAARSAGRSGCCPESRDFLQGSSPRRATAAERPNAARRPPRSGGILPRPCRGRGSRPSPDISAGGPDPSGRRRRGSRRGSAWDRRRSAAGDPGRSSTPRPRPSCAGCAGSPRRCRPAASPGPALRSARRRHHRPNRRRR